MAGTSRTDQEGPPERPGALEADQAAESCATEVLIGLLRIARQLAARTVEEHDDTAAVRILYYVGGTVPRRLSDVAAQAGLDHSTVSRHVKRLEDAGYLARTADRDDRRAFRLELTGSGRSFLDAAIKARAVVVHDAIAGFSNEDRHRLSELVRRLADVLEQPPASG